MRAVNCEQPQINKQFICGCFIILGFFINRNSEFVIAFCQVKYGNFCNR